MSSVPSQYTASSLFAGAPQPAMPQYLPSFGGGSAQLQLLLNMLVPMFLGSDSTEQMQFRPSVPTPDFLRAQSFYAQMGQAMGTAQTADTKTMEQFFVRLMKLSGMKITEERLKEAKQATSFLSSAAPIIEQMFPGVLSQFYGERGSAASAAREYLLGGRYLPDPVTGLMGYSGETTGTLARYIGQTLYGPSGIDPAVRGLPQDQLARFVQLQISRGAGPGVLRTSVDDEKLDRFVEQRTQLYERAEAARAALGGAAGEQAARRILRKAPKAADTFGGLLGQEELQELDKIGELPADQQLRKVDAIRFRKWAAEQAGVMRALKDMFGPDTPINQLIDAADKLMQGNVAGKSPQQIEMQLRTLNQLVRSSGMGMQGLARSQGMLAQLARSSGLRADAVLDLSQQQAAFGTAFNMLGLGDVPGLNKDKLSMQHAQLQAQAEGSAMANSLAAVYRLGETGEIKKGTQLHALYQALKRGAGTYTYKGKTYQTGVVPEQLGEIAQASGVNMGLLAVFQDQQAANRLVLRDQQQIVEVTRGAQFETDIRGPMEERIRNDLMVTGVKDATAKVYAQKVIEEIRRDPKKFFSLSPEEQRKRLQQVVPGLRPAYADAILGSIVPSAELGGYDDAASLFTLHDDKTLGAIEQAHTMARLDAEFAKATSGIEGAGGTIRRIVETVLTAKPDTPLKELLSRALGGQVRGKLAGQLRPLIKRLRDIRQELRKTASGGEVTPAIRKKRQQLLKEANALVQGDSLYGRAGRVLAKIVRPEAADDDAMAQLLLGETPDKLDEKQLQQMRPVFQATAHALQKAGRDEELGRLAKVLDVSKEQLLSGEFETDTAHALDAAKNIVTHKLGFYRTGQLRLKQAEAADKKAPVAAKKPARSIQAAKAKEPAKDAAPAADDKEEAKDADGTPKDMHISGTLIIPGLGTGKVSAVTGPADHELVS